MKLLILLLTLLGCNVSTSEVTTPLAATTVVRATLNFKLNGVPQFGTTVITEKSPSYKIEVPLSLITEKPLKLFFSTCHRNYEYTGLTNKDVWTYQYYPVNNLEDSGSCLVFITVITDAGLTHIGIIDLKDDSQTLPMRAWCGGSLYIQNGAVFCQGKEQLVQTIAFNEPVKMVLGANCKGMLPSVDKNTGLIIPNAYEYPAALGICVYVFKGKDSGKIGKLTVRGFTSLKDM